MKNPLRNTGLLALTTPEEQSEIRLVMGRVKLQRTFTQKTLSGPPIKFWRVVGPSTHPMCDGTGRYMTVDPYGGVEYMVDCTFCDLDGQMREGV